MEYKSHLYFQYTILRSDSSKTQILRRCCQGLNGFNLQTELEKHQESFHIVTPPQVFYTCRLAFCLTAFVASHTRHRFGHVGSNGDVPAQFDAAVQKTQLVRYQTTEETTAQAKKYLDLGWDPFQVIVYFEKYGLVHVHEDCVRVFECANSAHACPYFDQVYEQYWRCCLYSVRLALEFSYRSLPVE